MITQFELEQFVQNYVHALNTKESFRLAIDYAFEKTFNMELDQDMKEKFYQLAMEIDRAYRNIKNYLPTTSIDQLNKSTCLVMLTEIGII